MERFNNGLHLVHQHQSSLPYNGRHWSYADQQQAVGYIPNPHQVSQYMPYGYSSYRYGTHPQSQTQHGHHIQYQEPHQLTYPSTSDEHSSYISQLQYTQMMYGQSLPVGYMPLPNPTLQQGVNRPMTYNQYHQSHGQLQKSPMPFKQPTRTAEQMSALNNHSSITTATATSIASSSEIIVIEDDPKEEKTDEAHQGDDFDVDATLKALFASSSKFRSISNGNSNSSAASFSSATTTSGESIPESLVDDYVGLMAAYFS